MAREKAELPKLYKSLIDITKLAISKYLFVGTVDTKVLKFHDKGYSIRRQPVPMYGIEVGIQREPKYNKCIKHFSEMPKVKEIWDFVKPNKEPTEWDISSHIRNKYLDSFIVEVAKKTHGQFDLDTFDDVYSELEKFLMDDRSESKMLEISPLPHFQSELEKMELSTGLKIRKITREEKEGIFLDYSLSSVNGYSDMFVFLGCDFVIEYTWGRERPEVNARHVALALSLFKPKSRIDYHGSISYRISWWRAFAGLLGPEPMAHSKPLKLTKQDANKFLRFWENEFMPIVMKEGHFMKITLSRFEDFRRRRNWLMGLIDLAICLEAMYLRENQELSYRLSHRCATLLGYEKSAEEKEQIRKFIKIAYDIRSRLIHGEQIEWEKIKRKNEIELEAYPFVEQVFEYVRQSIRRFLALTSKCELVGTKHKNFLRIVDSSIYSERPLKKYLTGSA